MKKFKNTKGNRKRMYLRLAKKYERASNESGHINQRTYLMRLHCSAWICIALNDLIIHMGGEYMESTELKHSFPEFFLLEPTYEEKLEENIGFGCEAWWDISAEDVFAKKAIALYLCAEMCN